MALNKDTQVATSIILDKGIHHKLKYISLVEHRSVSGQVAFWIADQIAEYEAANGEIKPELKPE